MRTTGNKCNEQESGRQAVADKVKKPARKNKKAEIDWNTWWPFTRATGDALRQLNRRQPKPNPVAGVEEAPW